MEIISTTTTLVGASAWFAGRLFGPSADAVGEQLKAFATDRLRKIFDRAEELSPRDATEPLPAGFAVLALQKASFSEDAEIITDMWARLLLSASSDYNTMYNSYSDILSQLGAEDVCILNNLVPKKFGNRTHLNLRSSIRERLRYKFTAIEGEHDEDIEALIERATTQHTALLGTDVEWPGRVSFVEYPYHAHGNLKHGTVVGGMNINTRYDILIRQRLLETFSFDLNQSFSSPYVEGLLVTSLGLDFVAVCRGEK